METKMIRKGDVINTQVIPPKLYEWLIGQYEVNRHRDLYLYLVLGYIDLCIKKVDQETLDEFILSYCDEFDQEDIYLKRMQQELGRYMNDGYLEEESQILEILNTYHIEPVSKTVLCWLYPTDLFFIVWLGVADEQIIETHDR